MKRPTAEQIAEATAQPYYQGWPPKCGELGDYLCRNRGLQIGRSVSRIREEMKENGTPEQKAWAQGTINGLGYTPRPGTYAALAIQIVIRRKEIKATELSLLIGIKPERISYTLARAVDAGWLECHRVRGQNCVEYSPGAKAMAL